MKTSGRLRRHNLLRRQTVVWLFPDASSSKAERRDSEDSAVRYLCSRAVSSILRYRARITVGVYNFRPYLTRARGRRGDATWTAADQTYLAQSTRISGQQRRVVSQPTTDRLQTDYRPTKDRLQTDYRPTTGRLQTDYRPTTDRLQTDYRPTTDRLQTDYRPTTGRL